MVEYHGWITLRQTPSDEDSKDLHAIARSLEYEGHRHKEVNGLFAMRILNGSYFISLAGCHNHWSSQVDAVLHFFRLVGQSAPGSYGLLYVWDDEGPENSNNAFRILRLLRGSVTWHDDSLLSPCIPTLEDYVE